MNGETVIPFDEPYEVDMGGQQMSLGYFPYDIAPGTSGRTGGTLGTMSYPNEASGPDDGPPHPSGLGLPVDVEDAPPDLPIIRFINPVASYTYVCASGTTTESHYAVLQMSNGNAPINVKVTFTPDAGWPAGLFDGIYVDGVAYTPGYDIPFDFEGIENTHGIEIRLDPANATEVDAVYWGTLEAVGPGNTVRQRVAVQVMDCAYDGTTDITNSLVGGVDYMCYQTYSGSYIDNNTGLEIFPTYDYKNILSSIQQITFGIMSVYAVVSIFIMVQLIKLYHKA